MRVYVDQQKAKNLYLRFTKRSVTIPSSGEADLEYDDIRNYAKDEFYNPLNGEYGLVEFPERVPFNPATWGNGQKRILWNSALNSANGFGYASQETLLALDRICDVYIPNNSFSRDIDERIPEISNKRIGNPDCVGIVFNVPLFPRSRMPNEICGIYVPWETTRISGKMANNINSYDFVLTTANFLVDVFKKSGIKKPIYIVPHGVRSDIFTYVERPKRDTFTFGHWGTLQFRKGTDVAVDAFLKAFPIEKYPNVRLNIKATFPPHAIPFIWWDRKDPRIVTEVLTLTKQQLVNKLHSWDALIYPTRGEGFGLPIIEAMSTGLPVVITGWSAMKDFVKDKKTGIFVDYKLTPLSESQGGYAPEDRPELGKWAEPDIDDVAKKMVWVYEHQDEARKIGKNAAQETTQNWSWGNSAKCIVEAINDYLQVS